MNKLEHLRFMNLSNFFAKKIHVENDLEGTLECECINDVTPSFILKNIVGSKKLELLGSDINEIDLNMLLPDNFRKMHNVFITDILKNRENSGYWNLFREGKMNRPVNIINPVTKSEYTVKLNITLKSQAENKVVFLVIFTDINIINKIINTTSLLTHDLRSIIKSAQHVLSTIEAESTSKHNEENFAMLNELLEEAYQMCSKSRCKILTENIHHTDSFLSHDIKIYLEISKYLKKIRKIFTNINFEVQIRTNICIKESYCDTLWHLFLNITKNAVNANSTHIIIYVNNNEENELLIRVKDNGNGMSESTKINFFSRKLPENHIAQEIEANRGEGFLLSYKEFVTLGGTVILYGSEIGAGTEFIIKLNGTFETENFVLSVANIVQIQNILNKTEKKVVLLVDDSLLNLKILSLKLIKHLNRNYTHFNFPILTVDEWQNTGIINIEINSYIFVLASNGMFGKEIAMMLNPVFIISDIEMPLLNGIQMIKELLNYKINSRILINSAYVDENDVEISQLIQKNNIQFIEKGSNYDFVETLFNL